MREKRDFAQTRSALDLVAYVPVGTSIVEQRSALHALFYAFDASHKDRVISSSETGFGPA